MVYHAQKPNACIAYSLLQIGAIKLEDALEYAKTVALELNWRKMTPWLEEHFPGYVAEINKIRDQWPRVPKAKRVPKHGKGVLTVKLGPHHYHAISYENGMVMDPSEYGPAKAESWEDYSKRKREDEVSPVIIHVGKVEDTVSA